MIYFDIASEHRVTMGTPGYISTRLPDRRPISRRKPQNTSSRSCPCNSRRSASKWMARRSRSPPETLRLQLYKPGGWLGLRSMASWRLAPTRPGRGRRLPGPREPAEGFDVVALADTLYRLEPFLKRLSARREADLGRHGSRGLGDLLLVRRFFGPEILSLWRWLPGSDGPGHRPGPRRGDPPRAAVPHPGLRHRCRRRGPLRLRRPAAPPRRPDPECTGQAWAPVYSVTPRNRR